MGSGTAGRSVIAALAFVVGCTVADTTAPVTGTTPGGQDLPASSDLLVVGDWGAGTSSQHEVAAAMAAYADQHEVAAILTTGDNFYTDVVAELVEPFEWATDDDIPFLVTWGNHDVETETRVELVDGTFDDPPRWVRHEWGPVDLVILDSTRVQVPRQLDFLAQALNAQDEPTVVIFHHPVLSCGVHGDTPGLDAWVDAFDDDVFLVLTGHEHNYQRYQEGGVTYVVSGGGGATLTELAECPEGHPEMLAGASTSHFVALELNDALDATAIDIDGNVIDGFSLHLP